MISLEPATTGRKSNKLAMGPAASMCLLHLLLGLVQLINTPTAAASNQYYRLDEAAAVLLHNQVVAGQQNGIPPGHYEFEVAPKMEPPSVRKPPYPQSAQLCPGLDPFAGFSPRDSLCGDLNQGRVPINPLGQSISDQSYPFELIKNKTLQFLARALPVLKSEYETIPKVARYLPGQHLLNPTHQSSPLSQEHMQQLNQRFASANGFAPDNYLGAPYLRAARRKRHATGQGSARPMSAGVLVAEMSPNATLVVSSAHSSPGSGRIHSLAGRSDHTGEHSPMAVITKDGYKQVSGPLSGRTTQQQQQQSPQRTPQAHHSAGHSNNWPSASGAGQLNGSPSSAPLSAPVNERPQQQVNNRIQQHKSSPSSSAQENVSRAGNQAATNVNGNNGNRQQQQQHEQNGYAFQHQQQVAAYESPPAAQQAATHSTQAHHASNRRAAQVDQPAQEEDEAAQARSSSPTTDPPQHPPTSSGATTSGGVGQPALAAGKQDSSAKRRLSCGEAGNGFTSAICQAAAALIEGDRPPAWLQVVKHLGNAYSGASSDSGLLGPGSSSIWSLLGGLAASSQQEPLASNAKSGSANLGGSSKASSFMSLLGPISSLLSGGSGNYASSLVTAKDSSGSRADSAAAASSSSSSSSTSNSKQHEPQPIATSLASALGSSTMTKLALAGWASNAIASLVEYFVPSVFQSLSSSRTFSRRKKPYDPQEQFVDTPASMAALTAAATATNLPRQAVGAGAVPLPAGQAAAAKQPPTPCPSKEEYISPTFARNYQGAWKYVVQIPYEGYFTQTIQRTSCVRQKCEFTEGVCHESPRWVSLLVAEIYYPNTIFGGQHQAPAADAAVHQQINSQQQQQQPLSASSSTSSIQQVAQQQQQPFGGKPMAQDPLQMTDSLSNYNHNLNNAFINAANELGWDPTNVANMQHLANAYNYQLMQRNGLSTSGQQPQIESRQGTAQVQVPVGQQYSNQPLQQPQMGPANQAQQPFYNTDYITALAAATLQQNPNMNIQELISSLQLQQRRRKKRDVGQAGGQSGRPGRVFGQQQQQQQIAQHRSGVESAPSMNDIGAHGQQIMGKNQFNKQQAQQSAELQAASATFPAHNQLLSSQHSPPTSQMPQTSPSSPAAAAAVGGGGDQQQHQAAPGMSQESGANANQVECDGHDKLGCYVVRVYYDWFLVNGSCKCWKTTTGQGASGSQSSSGNSFLRRIFTG